MEYLDWISLQEARRRDGKSWGQMGSRNFGNPGLITWYRGGRQDAMMDRNTCAEAVGRFRSDGTDRFKQDGTYIWDIPRYLR